MYIKVNTDNNIEGREKLTAHIMSMLQHALNRFGDHITRVEVHLSDQNGDKSGPDDKRCMIEAHLKGRRRTSVSHRSEDLGQAIDGAIDRLQRSIEGTVEQLRGHG
jgi:ribosomal subunit interface protein